MGNKNNKIEDKTLFKNIKSDYLLERIFSYMKENILLKIIKYNKSIQKRLNKNINDYINYYKIIIEIIPIKNKNIFFIKCPSKYEPFYHIFFDNQKIGRNEKRIFYENDKVKKIKIIIDKEIKSLNNLFIYDSIEKINFIKFNRNDINDMSCMFNGCSSLKEINLNNFNTDNVTNMSNMFKGCSSLKEINLNNFNTDNVTDMSGMFNGCSSLIELNLNNFNTKKVTNMNSMFSFCSSLKNQKDLILLMMNNYRTFLPYF